MQSTGPSACSSYDDGMATDKTAHNYEIEINHAASHTRACVAPNRGGMVTTFDVGDRSVFFLDRASFDDAEKNVRGGNPVLFPTPGKLDNDSWAYNARSGSLKQHGFARNLQWKVEEQRQDAVKLSLESTDATRAQYPWDFGAALTYRVTASELHILAEIENRSKNIMPFGLGFHPYFAIKNKETFALETGATRVFDNVTKRQGPFSKDALVLGSREVDLHLLDHGSTCVTFQRDDAPVTIESDMMTAWVVWTLPGRDFVCVEPWTCPGNALNTRTDLWELDPHEMALVTLIYRA